MWYITAYIIIVKRLAFSILLFYDQREMQYLQELLPWGLSSHCDLNSIREHRGHLFVVDFVNTDSGTEPLVS